MTKDMRSSVSRIALSVSEAAADPTALQQAFQGVRSSFDKFCLIAGIEAFQELLEDEAAELCGERYQRHGDRRGRR